MSSERALVDIPFEEGRDDKDVTLEYSPNFHRHIVRHGDNGTVLESFPWLDQALQRYPTAKPLPLAWNQAQVAGAAASSSLPYPSRRNNTVQQDLVLLRDYLQTKLNWFPSQVDQMIRIYPSLVDWPVSVLKERIEFFLSPIPPNLTYPLDTSANALGAAPMDWPLAFYNHGYGAGMSLAQATHGLLTIPHVLMRVKILPAQEDCATSRVSSRILRRQEERLHMHRKMVLFYQETPSVVIQMTSRQLSYFLQGASNLDCATYSYLHWKGWDFHQMYTLLQALPATLEASSDLDAENPNEVMRRSALTAEWLSYWHVRFQMRPIHIQAMLKTHPRLSTYSTNQLLRNTHWLSQRLDLDSSQIRSLLFRMPSLLGMSVEALQNRTSFWTEQVGLPLTTLSQIILDQPSLLQYSVSNNLQPKLDFFRNRLHLERDEIRSLTTTCAKVWGRSLQGHFVPMAQGLVDAITYEDDWRQVAASCVNGDPNDPWREVGQKIFASAPNLLQYNWKRNLEPKVKYLLEQCGRPTARRVLLQTPRVLCQSFQHSLQPKVELLKTQCNSLSVLYQVPSLLLLSQNLLEGRLERVLHEYFVSNTTGRRATNVSHALIQSKHQSKRKSKRSIVRLDANNKPVQLFASVAEAASAAGVTRSTMYYILNVSGRRPKDPDNYSYRWVDERKFFADCNETSDLSSLTISRTGTDINSIGKRLKNDQAKNLSIVKPSSGGLTSLAKDLLARMVFVENTTSDCPTEQKSEKSLTLFVTARAYPSEYLLRGRRRSGGMAFHAPQFAREDWRKIVSVLWKGQKLQVLQDGKTMLLGYNYIRPSRPRCGLYAIREALRLARVWVDEELSEGRDSTTIPPITIITDSNYCLDQLGNETEILLWGTATKMESFVYNGAGPLHSANPDILYPLSRTYFRLVRECQVQVLFEKETMDWLGDAAHLAARLMYDSVK